MKRVKRVSNAPMYVALPSMPTADALQQLLPPAAPMFIQCEPAWPSRFSAKEAAEGSSGERALVMLGMLLSAMLLMPASLCTLQ
eukprot:12704-Heterococcus_DN1.PRE.1